VKIMPGKTVKPKSKKSATKVKTAGKSLWQKVLVGVFILAFGAIGGTLLVRSFAATAPLYLSPETQTVQNGATFTVDVRMSVNTTVDSVTAKVTYDPAVLDFVSVNTAESVFPTELQTSGGSGVVNISRGTFSPASFPAGSLIATMTFTAKATTSTTSLQLSGNAAYQGTFLNPGTSGATITVNDTTPPPPPTNGDTTAPVVTISSPASGSAPVRNKYNINASASDDVGVRSMQIVIDGSVVLNSNASQVSYNWNVAGKKVSAGNHTITVRATDAAGNVGSSLVTEHL
jgi:hypothetical protein